MKYLVNVTQGETSGCYASSFDSLEALRSWAQAKVAEFKRLSAKPVTVVIQKNGTAEFKTFTF